MRFSTTTAPEVRDFPNIADFVEQEPEGFLLK
jgi:hypothetical protein